MALHIRKLRVHSDFCEYTFRELGPILSGSHRSTHIASDLASRLLASQAKPQRESESQAFRIARS